MTSVRRCGICGAFVQEDDRFCWACGAEVQPEGRPVQPRAPVPPKDSNRETQLALRRAHLAQHRGRLAEAERLVQEVLAREPDNVPALSMLSEILRVRGDLVEAVAVAQRATDAAAGGGAPPGAVAHARTQRAHIEETVVRQSAGALLRGRAGPLALLLGPGPVWYRGRNFYLVLAAFGIAALFLAVVAVFQGDLVGYIWICVSLLAAGWSYQDAETRREAALFWGLLVLGLGPFGLAIYLLITY
jgi:hypothetical protein